MQWGQGTPCPPSTAQGSGGLHYPCLPGQQNKSNSPCPGHPGKLHSAGQRSDKSGWRCPIQPPAPSTVSTGFGPGQDGISIKHIRKALCQLQGALPLHKHHLQSPEPTTSISLRTTRQEEDIHPGSAIRCSPGQPIQTIRLYIKTLSEKTIHLKPIVHHHLPARRPPETQGFSRHNSAGLSLSP